MDLNSSRKITFKELRLPQKVDLSDGPCYMVSLTHNLLAFAVADGLYMYFIELKGII